MSSALKIAGLVLLALLAALAGMWLARVQAPSAAAPAESPALALEHATVFPAPRLLPDFELLDQNSLPFGPDRFNGHWSFVFFGFTNCPDVCPTTLATLAATRRELASMAAAEQPEVVLVSVDPGRDKPERLAQYVAFFDPSFTGVTGDPARIRQLSEALGVAVIIGPADANGNYTVDHSATVFLVDPQGRLVAVFSTPHTPDGIAHDYRLILQRLADNPS
jgi:protein SCO1/2